MDRRDVLSALGGVELPDGGDLLASGRVQDILIERHGEAAHVAVVVDDDWGSGGPPAAVVEAIVACIRSLPGVASARVVPRPRPARPRPAGPGGASPAVRLPAGARVIAVASAKGGVGKTTVTVNLAVALAALGRRAAVLDLDLYGMSAPDVLGVGSGPTRAGAHLVPPRAHGVAVLSLAFFVRDNAAVAWRGPMLGKAIRQMLDLCLWQGEEVFLLDLPPGTGDVLLDVLRDFPQAAFLVVTTPDPRAARVAERVGSLARRAGRRILGVVENMAYATCPQCGGEVRTLGQGGGDRVAAALGTGVLARIPMHPADVPTPATEGPVAAAYRALARKVDRLTANPSDRQTPTEVCP